MKRQMLTALAIATCVGSTFAVADGFRCGVYLVREGMSSAEILEKCGEPLFKDVVEEPVFARRSNGTTYQIGVEVSEFWEYDRGSNQFLARITLKEGIATEINLESRQSAERRRLGSQ